MSSPKEPEAKVIAPSLFVLLGRVLGEEAEVLLRKALAEKGIHIAKRETVRLSTKSDAVEGEFITLSDGRVFRPKVRYVKCDDGVIEYGYDWHQDEEDLEKIEPIDDLEIGGEG